MALKIDFFLCGQNGSSTQIKFLLHFILGKLRSILLTVIFPYINRKIVTNLLAVRHSEDIVGQTYTPHNN